ncbi:MAG: 30S ribosomal protein S6 [Nitrospirota bacterium]
MNIYENIIIFNAALSDEDIETAASKIKDIITGSGGEILKADNWGRRKLAFEIKKQKKGLYMLLLFRLDPSVVKKLESHYKVTDSVIKFMVVRLGKKALAAGVARTETSSAAAPVAAEQKSEE